MDLIIYLDDILISGYKQCVRYPGYRQYFVKLQQFKYSFGSRTYNAEGIQYVI